MAFKISSPFLMENKQCESMRKQAAKLAKEVQAMRAESKKTVLKKINYEFTISKSV